MTIRIGPGIVVGQQGIRLSGGGAAAVSWWLSGGISAANAVAVYQPIGAASLAASYVNLANPGTYDATTASAPGWSAAAGWIFTTQSLTTGAPLPLSGGSLFVRFANAAPTGGGATFAGNRVSGTDGMVLWNKYGSVTSVSYGGLAQLGAIESAGVLGLAGTRGYFNGVAFGAAMSGSFSAARDLFIGSFGGIACEADILAVALYTAILTADQVAAVSTAMAAL